MKRQILRLPSFVRKVKKLLKRQPELRDGVVAAIRQLEDDAFHPSLKTHKLKGEFGDSWSSSAGYDLRIIFLFVKYENLEAIALQSIGTHDEVY